VKFGKMRDKCSSHHNKYHHESLEILEAAGLKRTSLRIAILEALSKKNKPCSQKELIEILTAKTKGEIDRVSIYRNIQQFLKAGIIHEVAKNAYVTCQHLHGGSSPVHVLLYCLKCARHEEVCEESEKSFFQQLMGRAGFFSKPGRLQVSGVCQSCALG